MYVIVKIKPWWTREELEASHQMVEEMFDGDCGGWTWDPPCGGCLWCGHAMVAHAQDEGYDAPSYRASLNGLKFWPVIRTVYRYDAPSSFPAPDSHDRSHWWNQGACKG